MSAHWQQSFCVQYAFRFARFAGDDARHQLEESFDRREDELSKYFEGTLGGPIMIAQMAGEQAKAGAGNLVFFIALISINLAILNFLPIPVLDGGHLLFFFIEAAIGRPVSIKMREIAQQIGIFILILLMIYVFYNDIVRIFFSSSG